MKTLKVNIMRIDDVFTPEMLAITDKAIDLAIEVNAEFGERCPDFDPDCCVCKAWKVYDRKARTLVRG